MATPGRKPKPHHLKLVEGNAGKRPNPEAVDPAKPPEGHEPLDLPPPAYLKSKRAQALWAEIFETCWWLNEVHAYKVGMWCSLQAEFESKPKGMIAARIKILQTLGSELGLDPASAARLGGPSGKRGNKNGKKVEPETNQEKYFT